MKVEFYKTNLDARDIARVENILKGIFLTTGNDVYEFEKVFSSYLGVKHSVGVMSCTAALHIALLAHNIGPQDEVITTPMTFIATANSILYTGAMPVFADVESQTGCVDVKEIEKVITSKTKAIIPVHLYGQMCDMVAINKLAKKHGLIVIEDCAHAVESLRDNIRPGQLSNAACFSFYATKNITSGEGGAVVTNSDRIADKLKVLRQHGMTKNAAQRYADKYKHWDMEMLGWKCNMNNIQASLLIGQLKRIEKLLVRREEIARRYERAFSELKGVDFPRVPENSRSSRHLFTIWVKPNSRDKILRFIQQRGVGVAVNYRAVHLLKYYREKFKFKSGAYPVAERIGNSTITLPLYPKLTDAEVGYVIETVKKAVKV